MKTWLVFGFTFLLLLPSMPVAPFGNCTLYPVLVGLPHGVYRSRIYVVNNLGTVASTEAALNVTI
jgi:hypothetical protein